MKLIVVYDLPDPEGQYEGEENEEKRDDLENYLRADVEDSGVETQHSDWRGKMNYVSCSLLSDEQHKQACLSIWKRGTGGA